VNGVRAEGPGSSPREYGVALISEQASSTSGSLMNKTAGEAAPAYNLEQPLRE
jgi:hypothetical protein